MRGKLFTFICVLALTKGVLSYDDPISVCSRACKACKCLPTEPPTKCSAEESEGILLPHENCNQFYICSHGSKVTFDCPSNLFFNPVTEQCDYPDNVICGDKIIPDEEDINEESDDPISVCSRACKDCECLPTEPTTICSAEEAEGILLPHENCNQFYICSHGSKVTFDCPSNLFFNPVTEQCDYPDNVICGDKIIPDEEDINEESDDPISVCSRACKDCECLPTEPPTICSAEEAEGILLPHENCNQFYICNHGSKVTFDCPSNLFFNPVTEQCDYPDNVICGDKIIPDEEDINEESDDPISVCSRACKDCECLPTEPPTICSAEEAEGILLPHENCNQFYICSHGSKVTFDCPSKLFFNPVTEQCDYLQNVVCGDKIIPDKDSNEVSDSSESNNDDTATDRVEEEIKDHSDEERSDENNDNDIHVETEIDLFEIAKVKCSETESDGYMSVHENCHQFYVCLKHEPAVLSCPLGLLYDIPTQTCLWPQDVQCEKRNLVTN